MRIIYRASLVFLLKDIYSKTPLTNAVILCNGKQNPYTRKKEGYYVFSNLYPGNYEISISCVGYNDLNFFIELKENETKEVILDLSYAPSNQHIMNLSRFDITCIRRKKLLKDIPLTLKLSNPLEFLKLVEPIKSGSDEVKLNLEMVTGLMGQKYLYEAGEKTYEIVLWSYDQEKKCYILKDFAHEEIPADGKFFAVWEIRTDPNGRAILPLMSQFMKDDALEFECFSEGIKSKISFDVAGKQQSGEVFYEKANFRKIPKRRKLKEE